MTQQILDVRGSLRLLRRFWRTVALFVLAGLVAVAAYEYERPPEFQATSLVLLPEAAALSNGSTQTPTGNDITTDARIAISAAVLVPAGRKVDPSWSLSSLEHRVSTSASATGVLAITASAPTSAQAEALANAVASQLVNFVTFNSSVGDSSAVSGLQNEANALDKQVAAVQQEINTANQNLANDGTQTAAGQQDSNVIASLTVEQTNLSTELNAVQNEITQAKLGQISANQGTEVIQQATMASRSLSAIALAAVIGAAAGLLVGSLFVLARHRKDPRLWTRDQLAVALGSPVVLSLGSLQDRQSSDWVEVLEEFEPASFEQWNVHKALRELGVGENGAANLVMLTLCGDLPSVTVALKVALAAASSGLDTVFALDADQPSTTALKAALSRFPTPTEGPRPGFGVVTGIPPASRGRPDLTVIALVVDDKNPNLPKLGQRGYRTVLVLSAGFASAEQLARVAIATTSSGHPLAGIVVTNPDSEDQTTGRLPGTAGRRSPAPHRRNHQGGSPALSGRVQ